LAPDLADEFWIWRPILAGKVTLRDVKDGTATVTDLLKLGALLDMQSDIERDSMEKNK
jgi:hypothetical protein